jgi:hypothetical protein
MVVDESMAVNSEQLKVFYGFDYANACMISSEE